MENIFEIEESSSEEESEDETIDRIAQSTKFLNKVPMDQYEKNRNKLFTKQIVKKNIVIDSQSYYFGPMPGHSMVKYFGGGEEEEGPSFSSQGFQSVDFSTSTTFNGSFSTSSLLSIGDRYFHKDKTQIGIRSIKFAKSPYRDYKNVTVGGVNFGDFTSVDTTTDRTFASNGLEEGDFIKKRYLPLIEEGGTSDEEMEVLFGTNGLDAPNDDVSIINSDIININKIKFFSLFFSITSDFS